MRLGSWPMIRVSTNRASGVCWGCLSHVHSPGAEGVGEQESTDAVESSATSRWVPPFSLFLFEKFFLFKPPWSKQAPGLSHSPAWLTPKNPTADPAPPAWGFSHPGPGAGPRDLIVLKHSSYRQIFQCPLSLVSDLHICWNTVGCSLCSSDQLGVSLGPKGSGLHSHLSRCHLLFRCSLIFNNIIWIFMCRSFTFFVRCFHKYYFEVIVNGIDFFISLFDCF